jgi:AAA domain
MEYSSTKDSAKTVNVFVYGPSGTGKTVLCSTAPKPVIISSERGLMSIAEFDIPVLEISSLEDLKEAYEKVKKSKEFETVCLDSISDIAETCLMAFKQKNKDMRKAFMDLQDEITDMCRKFRDLKLNTYVVGKSIESTDAGGQTTVALSMPSKRLANDIPYIFDLVLAMRAEVGDNKEVEYFLQTKPSAKYYAKDRSKTLDPFEDADLSKIFAKVAARLTKKKGGKNGKGKKGKKGKGQENS